MASSTVDTEAARDLYLSISSDGELYKQQHLPIILNLMRKLKKGTYNTTKALKLFEYLTESGARKLGSGDSPNWRSKPIPSWLNKPTRRATALFLRDDFETEAGHGNYDNLDLKIKRYKHPLSTEEVNRRFANSVRG